MIIASEVMPGIVWNVERVADGNAPDASEMETENEFIRSFNPVVLSNGLTGKASAWIRGCLQAACWKTSCRRGTQTERAFITR